MTLPSTARRRTPLDAAHRALGATMTDFAGWQMPLRYGSERAEHLAVRTAAGLFDLSHMAEIGVRGPAAADALDFALTGQLSTLAPGRARYTMLCREDGGVLDDLVVYRLDDRDFLVVANAGNAEVVHDALAERAAGFTATVRDERDAWALIAVQGPAAARILQPLTEPGLSGLRGYAARPGTVAGVRALVARTGYTGEDGFELFVAPPDAERVWAALREAGDGHGLQPCGLASRDTLRLEAGMPLYGHELTTATTPFDAGLGRTVVFGKPGPFVGRAALAEAAGQAEAAGRRRLAGLVVPGRRVPRAGYPVLGPDGAVVGEVTSGAPSPTLGRPVAMAYLDARHARPGAEGVAVDVRGHPEPCDVVPLPFYRRAR